jgi:flagellar motility protein MotE (MotC chaperone)
LAALGGIGFLVYQNMEKAKSGMPKVDLAADSTSLDQYMQESATTHNSNDSSMAADTAAHVNTETTNEANTEANTNDPTKNSPAKDKPTLTTKSKTTTNTAKQKADALIAKQKEQEAALQKQQEAQAAALAKARNYRNNWASYITIGKLDIKKNKDDGIDPFDIPVRNNTNALLEKVTLRVDYWKKDKKVVNSETVNVYNVPAGTILNGKASGYKKGTTAKVIITGITSRKLNFCYPGSSYAPDDPFFCK